MQIELFQNNYSELNKNDVVFTPEHIAKWIIEQFDLYGTILDPCMGEGSFYNNYPSELKKEWCEITKGKDFYEFTKKVDWVITNPPYSDFNRFFAHCAKLADNIVLLVPVAKIFKSWGTLNSVKQYGLPKSIYFIPASRCGFAFGFPCGVFHFVRNFNGLSKIEFAPE